MGEMGKYLGSTRVENWVVWVWLIGCFTEWRPDTNDAENYNPWTIYRCPGKKKQRRTFSRVMVANRWFSQWLTENFPFQLPNYIFIFQNFLQFIPQWFFHHSFASALSSSRHGSHHSLSIAAALLIDIPLFFRTCLVMLISSLHSQRGDKNTYKISAGRVIKHHEVFQYLRGQSILKERYYSAET